MLCSGGFKVNYLGSNEILIELHAISTARSCKYIWYGCIETLHTKKMTRHKCKKLYLRTNMNCWHKLTSFCILTVMAILHWLSKLLLSTYPTDNKVHAEVSVNISWQLNLGTKKKAFLEHPVPMTLPPAATLLYDDQSDRQTAYCSSRCGFSPLGWHHHYTSGRSLSYEAKEKIKLREGWKPSYKVTRHECSLETSIRKVMWQQSQQQMCCSTITILSWFAMSSAVRHPPVLVSLPCHYGTRRYSFP